MCSRRRRVSALGWCPWGRSTPRARVQRDYRVVRVATPCACRPGLGPPKARHNLEETHMTVVTTLDVHGMSPEEYRTVMDKLGVEQRPEAGIYLHATITTDFGYRIVELWDRKEGFEAFLETRLAPAMKALGIDRKTDITITPLHNLFAPRLSELPGLVGALPGGPRAHAHTT